MRKWLTSRSVWITASCLALAVGIYLFLVASAPVYISGTKSQVVKQKIQSTSTIKENRLYIPAIGVDVEVAEGNSEAVLEKGAWHRRPQSGNPEKGGNFVLSAHRFQMGLTPQQTSAKSPFYHIDKLKEGDKIHVDYSGKRYTYEIFRKYQVDRLRLISKIPRLKLR